jgi:hypothetical protein
VSNAAQIAGSTSDADAAQAWRAMRTSADIQFAPMPPIKPPETPGWMKALSDFLKAVFEPLGRMLGVSWPVIEKVLIALAILAVLFLAWRLLSPLLGMARRRAAPEPDWSPDHAQAVALLEDADALAAQGRFGEAAHLLLQRSVHHIGAARPDWLLPASTAREIAALPMLPERARRAFAEIATRVERSLFALRDLDSADWQAARSAYADFALADLAGTAR